MSQPHEGSRELPVAQLRLPRLSAPLWMAAIAISATAAVMPGLWSMAGLAAFVATGLVILWPEIAVYLLALSVPLGSLAVGERESSSFAVTPTEVITGLMVVGWLLRGLARRRLVFATTPLTIPLVAVMLIVAASATQATSLPLALKEWLKWAELFLVYLFVVAEMGSPRQILPLLLMLLMGAMVEATLGIVQFALGIGPEFFAIGRFMRAYGTFDQPNPYAGYLGMLIPLGVGLLLGRPSPRVRAYALVGVAAAGVGVSLSRGAWLGIALALGLMALFWSRRSRVLLSVGVLASAPVGVLAFMNLLPAEVSSRITTVLDYFRFVDVTKEQVTTQNWAVIERVAHWQAALDMIAAHPLLGVGAGNYPAVYEWYAVQGWPEPLGHAHNFYLNMAAETGIPGLLAYMSFVITALVSAMLWLARSSWLHSSAPREGGSATRPGEPADRHPRESAASRLFWRGILLGVLGALVASFTHNMFDNLFVHSMSVQLGIILALGQVSAYGLRRDAPPKARDRREPIGRTTSLGVITSHERSEGAGARRRHGERGPR